MTGAVLATALFLSCATPAPPPPAVPLVGATSEGPFVPGARDLFAGCTPLPDSPTSRTWRCAGMSLWLEERQDLEPAQALAEARSRVIARLGASGLTESRESLPLAGESWPALRFAACAPNGACRASGYVTVVSPLAGRRRQLGCIVPGADRAELARCLERFEFLAAHGNPEGDVLDPAALLMPPRLPWRVLTVPPGCRLASSTSRSGRIRCEDATFSWSVFAPTENTTGLARWRDQSVAELHDALPGSGPVEEVDCRLEVRPTRCFRFTTPGPQGARVLWAAEVTWQGGALFAACDFPSSAPGFPAACNGVFTPR
ncbi:hypothetical protein JGU66_05640 [Myxococcaceae bacterium JPH2]|nr:hypothetical protein [Myxococcaceae bacterium JPH2]